VALARKSKGGIDMVAENNTDIAIVGMAGRFPGAADVDALWDLVAHGEVGLQEFDEESLRAAGVPSRSLHDSDYVRVGGVLDDVALFDAGFFGYGPRDAAILDPQHRHFLEVSWTALEHSGHVPGKFDGAIGVFAGCGMSSYLMHNLLTNPALIEELGMFLVRHTGNDKDFLATEVAYALNLTGPAISVQTACSTSLVAVHLAASALLNVECDLALAGGVTIEVPHRQGYLYKEGEILSQDGKCRAFDAASSGTVLGSGAGAVVLRRAQDAYDDGDTVYAVLKSSAINNDGSGKIGYLAPSVDGHANVVTEALALAGVTAEEIGYCEAHGTGTKVGDPIEIAALTSAYRATTDRQGFCRLGSIKPNIGHLDTAAGVASLIKALQILRHRAFPPLAHFSSPNPLIDFAATPFLIPESLTPWPDEGRPRRVGISSLGVGGTNCHVILQEAPVVETSDPPVRVAQLLAVSAKSSASLQAGSAALATFLEDVPADAASPDAFSEDLDAAAARGREDAFFADVAFTLQEGREEFPWRQVVVAENRPEAARLLASGDSSRVFSSQLSSETPPSVVFLFPGGGAHFLDMGRDLYQTEPVYRAVVDECQGILQKRNFLCGPDGIPLDVRVLMWPEAGANRADAAGFLENPAASFATIVTTECALARLYMSWGVEPDAVCGHSLGEYVAAHVAGVFSLEDMFEVVMLRAELFARGEIEGATLTVSLDEESVRPYLVGEVSLAVVNLADLCVVSGAADEVTKVQTALESDGIDCKRLPLAVAAHSSLLDPVLSEFEQRLAGVAMASPQIGFISNLTGAWAGEEITHPEYWVRHLRGTVRFADGLQTLGEVKNRVLLEVGPGHSLASLARRSRLGVTSILSGMRHPEDKQEQSDAGGTAYCLTILGRLWLAGVELDWLALHDQEIRNRVPLPGYQFDRQEYWIAPGTARSEKKTLEKQEKLEDWFWVPRWCQSDLGQPTETALQLLVFSDKVLGDSVVTRLRETGHKVVTVVPGDEFGIRLGSEYCLNPSDPAQYAELFAQLAAKQQMPQRILHLWALEWLDEDVTSRRVQLLFPLAFQSILFLAQALSRLDDEAAVDLVVATANARAWGPGTVVPGVASLFGLLRVLSQELPHVSCRAVDLDWASLPQDASSGVPKNGGERKTAINEAAVGPVTGPGTPQVAAHASLSETWRTIPKVLSRVASHVLAPLPSSCPTLVRQLVAEAGVALPTASAVQGTVLRKGETAAWRAGVRWTEELEAFATGVDPDEILSDGWWFERSWFRENGVYLITGGLDGVGAALGRELARHWAALAARAGARLEDDPGFAPGRVRFVLLGRTPLPARADWDVWQKRHDGEDRISRRIRSVEEIEAAGAEVLVLTGDVTNRDEMRDLLAQAKRRFGGIDGVFHAAGAFADDLLMEKTPEAVAQVMAPKVQGTLVLDEVLDFASLDFVVLFSSTSSFLGLAGQADYAGANAFVNAYAEAARSGGVSRVIALDWGIWKETGFAARTAAGKPEYNRLPLRAGEHPLLGREVEATQDRIVHVARHFSTDWIFDEHRVRRSGPVLPGTGYVELARAALARVPGVSLGDVLELRDLVFTAPLPPGDKDGRETFTILSRQKEPRARMQSRDETSPTSHTRASVTGETPTIGAQWQIEVLSKTGRGNELPHMIGTVQAVQASSPPPQDLAALAARCATRVCDRATSFGKQSDGKFGPSWMHPQQAHLDFGPRWDNARWARYGDDEALVFLELDDRYLDDIVVYSLHPALLDMAAGLSLSLLEDTLSSSLFSGGSPQEPDTSTAADLYVPVGYGRVRVYAPLLPRVFAHVRLREVTNDTVCFDMILLDEKGNVRVEIETLLFQRVPSTTAFGAIEEKSMARQAGGKGTLDLVSEGIAPAEGIEALCRLLRDDRPPWVCVSSLDIPALMRHVEENTQLEAAKVKAPRPAFDEELVGPRDDIEAVLREMWEDVLGVEGISVHDDFFELGGHSLVALRFFTQLRKRLHVDLALSTLFEAPTIARLAGLLRERGLLAEETETQEGACAQESAGTVAELSSRSLVVIRKEGTLPPYFCIHGRGGNVLTFQRLASHLPEDLPMYALQARGVDMREKPHDSIEEMAEAYLDEVLEVQPHGPYYFGGYSGGGVIALEMAHRLRARGEIVALITMFDTYSPSVNKTSMRFRFGREWNKAKEHGVGDLGKRVWNKSVLALGNGTPTKPFFLSPEEAWFKDMEDAFIRKQDSYRLSPYDGDVVLFRALDNGRSTEFQWTRHMGWEEWLRGSFRVVDIPGTHTSLFMEPNVSILALAVRRALDAAWCRYSFPLKRRELPARVPDLTVDEHQTFPGEFPPATLFPEASPPGTESLEESPQEPFKGPSSGSASSLP